MLSYSYTQYNAQTPSTRLAAVTARRAAAGLVLLGASALAAGACSTSSSTGSSPVESAGHAAANSAAASAAGTSASAGTRAAGGGAALTGASGSSGPGGAGTHAGQSTGSSAGAGGQHAAAGSAAGAGPAAHSGGAGAGGGAAGQADAGGAQARAGAGGANAGQGGAPSDAGPADYSKPGPYKVVVEKNVGAKFRNSSVYDDALQCDAFIGGLAGGDPNANPDVIKQLTSYPQDMDRGLYTLFRPETLEADKKYPVITWGNGTCSQPLLFEELLTHLASHGFIIIASNWRWVASGQEMLRGIDFIVSENENSSSPLYGKVDTKMLGACGHSQGSMATVVVGADKRIVATVPIEGANASDVVNLKGPTFLIAGELDMIVDPSTVEQAFNAATVPAVFGLSLGHDHLMPGLDPSPIVKAVTTWFKIHLSGDQQSRGLFYGDPCGLCADSTWKVRRNNL